MSKPIINNEWNKSQCARLIAENLEKESDKNKTTKKDIKTEENC
jgi:hypothetical protein